MDEGTMDEAVFSAIVAEEWAAVPEVWKARVENVAVLVEDVPSDEVRAAEGLADGEMLLGIYQGIPTVERGEGYGIGMTLPDTITVYRLPTLLEAGEMVAETDGLGFRDAVRQVVRDTLWHELGHYFGHDDEAIHEREDRGTNAFGA